MNNILKTFDIKTIVEFGGPSEIYHLDKTYENFPNIDVYNLTDNNIWFDDSLKQESLEKYGVKFSIYNVDVHEILNEENKTYDLILSCHQIEHLANPIKSILSWKNLNSKYLYCVIPDKNFTFDSNRDVTKLSHLIDDYENNITEHDQTHIREILEKRPSEPQYNYLNNYLYRVAHHHVFDFYTVKEMFDYVGFEILSFEYGKDMNIKCLLKM